MCEVGELKAKLLERVNELLIEWEDETECWCLLAR
jgi:hypothetical protein